MLRLLPRSTLFPYMTLFRSPRSLEPRAAPPQIQRGKVDVRSQVLLARRAKEILAGAMLLVRQRSEEHTSELQSLRHLVCRLLLEKKKIRHIQLNIPQILVLV